MMVQLRLRWIFRVAAAALGLGGFAAPVSMAVTPVANLMSVSTAATNFGYATGDTNSCAIDHNDLITAGNFQYIAYYGPTSGGRNSIFVSRRAVGTTTWSTPVMTNISISSTSDITDDHDVIAIGVDSTGHMHISWDMHNIALNYGISAGVVNDASFSSLSFNTKTAATSPTLFPSGGTTTNEVTYPEFFNIPGTNNMVFAYRNGGAGGGSGNGDQYIDVYNPTTGTWSNTKIINGQLTSVNAYLNGFVYNSQGTLLTTWTWRASPDWQTNSNIMIAQSPDNGTTWFKQGGATQYTLPIIQAGTPASSVAQTVWTIPQHSSFINQTTMTVDNNDNPMVATYWAPGTLGSTNSTLAPNATTNNPNRQYMLVYYDGTQWRTSQITHRTSDTAFDTSAADVRDLGRPIVLTDAQNRTLVVTRSEDTSLGSSANPNLGLNKNNIVVYYSTNLDSANPTWSSITLDSANMGTYEPTYDATMWKSNGILDLFYEPTGLGTASTAVKVLEWNEQHYFSVLAAVATPHPGDLDFDGTVTNSDLQAMLDALKNVGTFKATNGLSDSELLSLSDVNGDGVFNAADVQSLLGELTAAGGSGSKAVPEPASLVLISTGLLVGLVALCARGPRSLVMSGPLTPALSPRRGR
jgi:BNR repeat-containing family member/Dockerin type I domain